MIRLQVGQIEEGGEKVGDNRLKKRALLVYEGTFQSMDGEVTLTDKDLKSIADNYNSGIERLKRLFGQGPKVQVPVQLDHSTKAIDTIGRVDGPVEVGSFKDEDGKEKVALYGQLMFIGKDNVERAEDGRWTHLSVGLTKNKTLSEVSVTPFPAAPHASLLSLGTGEMDMSYSAHKALHKKYKKALKHLTKHKGMSEEDAEKHLESSKPEDVDKMAAEHEEHEKKMAAEAEEKEKQEKDEKLSRLSAATAQLKAEQDAVRLAERKLDISIRLSSFVSKGKLTPAEMKKIDMVKLASKGDEVVDAVMQSYEDRQPVILMGQAGTTKAVEPGKLGAEIKRLKRQALEAEAKDNMPFTGTALANIARAKKRLANDGGAMPTGSNVAHMGEDIGGQMPGGSNVEHMADKPEGVAEPSHYHGLEADYETLHKMMEEGRHDEAKEHLKSIRAKHKQHLAEHGSEEAHHMSAISSTLKEVKEAHKRLRAKLETIAH